MANESCCSGCNRPDLPWAGRGTALPIAGCRFTLYPMTDRFIDIILGALEKTDTSAVWSETDALSTVYRGKLPYVADAVQARFAEGNPTGVKCALAAMGRIGNTLRLPLVPGSKALEERLRRLIAEYDLR